MKIIHSGTLRAAEPSAGIAGLLAAIDQEQLRAWVERMAVPRHFTAEAEQNRATANWLSGVFEALGFRVERQGEHGNVVASPRRTLADVILVGAHYDSVPNCPGADDNASAVAAMLGCATACHGWDQDLAVIYVAFNREEEHLLGSGDFVESFLPKAGFRVRCAHVLEMVGYTSSEPESQQLPTGLPVEMSSRGDYLGLLANARSGPQMERVLGQARTYVERLPVSGLEVEQGAEKLLPVLGRSDHVPFWGRDIPAIMWTDTAEFRNPHYHRSSDTPDTLDYRFLRRVTQLLTATILTESVLKSGARSL